MRFPVARLVYMATFVVIVAVLSHLLIVLTIPEVAEHDAYARVAALTPTPFRTIPLPAPVPGHAEVPFLDPAVAAAVCRYDLSSGPVRVMAPLGRAAFASLSFHSRRGVAFYALTDRAASRAKMEAVIVTAEQLRTLVAHDDEDNPSEDLRIVSPTREGFVMTRVLSRSDSDLPDAAATAAAMTCAIDPVAEAEK